MSSKIFIAFILVISFLKVINEKSCPENNIENRNECFTNSTSDSYCCFDSNAKKCVLVKKDKLKNNIYDCGISDDNYGKYEFREYHPNQDFNLGFQTCGETEPKNKEDCTKYSELTNSCCFFKKKNQEETACLAIGRKFGNDIHKTYEYNYNNTDYEYECKSFNIILSFYSFLLIGLNLL